MGTVYEAFDQERKTRVALKTLTTLTSESLLMFKNEFRALQDIQHPNLVRLGELFESAGQWFFTMELVVGTDFISYVSSDSDQKAESPTDPDTDQEGDPDTLTSTDRDPDTLTSAGREPASVTTPVPADPSPGLTSYDPAGRSASAKIQRHRCELQRLRSALASLIQGVYALHAAHKIHRDLKPSNILVTPQGRVVILDFGIISDLHRVERWNQYKSMGTVAYMAPEQADA